MTKDKKHHKHENEEHDQENKPETCADASEVKKEENAQESPKASEMKEDKQDEVQKYKALSDDYLNQLQRLQAEFDNFRKREERQRLALKEVVIQNMMKDFLPFVDNFERALISSDSPNITLESLRDGIKLIFKQLETFLARLNVTRIDALGKPFDPTKHEAVSKICSNEYNEDCVMQVLQNGWTMNETVIRPTMVVVSGGKPAGADQKPADDLSATEPLK